jgi:hypothetical protein
MRYKLALSSRAASGVLIVAAFGLAVPAGAEAQSTCPNLNGPTCFLPTANVSMTPPATLIMVITQQAPPLPPSVCIVEEEGYLKWGTLARVHVAATTTGGCEHRYWGQYFYTELYGLNWLFWRQLSPTYAALPNYSPGQPRSSTRPLTTYTSAEAATRRTRKSLLAHISCSFKPGRWLERASFPHSPALFRETSTLSRVSRRSGMK